MEYVKIIEIYYLLFMSYAFIGWSTEVIGKLFQYHRFINRGFLIGPYCPIYGWGGLLITIFLRRLLPYPVLLFFFTIFICSIVEYSTSYFMEKHYNARWWDYSQRKFNINGRICLNTMIPFGIMGMIVSYIVNPFLLSLYNRVLDLHLHIISLLLFTLFMIDNIVSKNVIQSVNSEFKKYEKDNTEEITKKVREVIMNKGWASKRLINAFPNIKNIRIKARENMKKTRVHIEETKEKARQDLSKNIEKIKEKRSK